MPADPPSPSAAPIPVVAGVIRDPHGRVLLTQRTRGRDLAGLWEFPGGKVEPGEPAATALARELHEELGLRVEVGELLISVPQRMAHKRIVLQVHQIARWQGVPRGLDGQALAWSPLEQLRDWPMPPADLPVCAALQAPARLLVTPTPTDDDEAWLATLARALEAGIRRVQLRAPGLEPARWQRLAAAAVALCRAHAAEVLLNGDAALAVQLGCGLHLPSSQLLARRERPALAAGQALSASCHDLAQLRQAAAIGCDFAVVGTLKPSASHPGRPGIGWPGFVRLREESALPLYAIGGLGEGDIAEARRHGAQGIAAIRALWPAAVPAGGDATA
ncbi:Nudix family hydrolase [Luteimonas sp. e5]